MTRHKGILGRAFIEGLLSHYNKEAKEQDKEQRRSKRLEEIEFRTNQKLRIIEAQRRLLEEKRLNDMNPNLNIKIC